MFDVKVIGYQTNAKTGYTVVYVCAVKEEGNTTVTGPEKGYGIEADTLKHHYGGDLNNWLAWVKQEHQKYHGLHESMEEQLKALVGTKL